MIVDKVSKPADDIFCANMVFETKLTNIKECYTI